jgi:hypothetical protein
MSKKKAVEKSTAFIKLDSKIIDLAAHHLLQELQPDGLPSRLVLRNKLYRLRQLISCNMRA